MIIGLTGTLSSGTGIFSDFLREKGFVYLSLSNELREIAQKEKIEITRKSLQDLGNAYREKYGVGFLAEQISNKIKREELKNVVVDGIRNPGEVSVLRKHKDFFLITVDAPQELRFRRMAERNRERDPKIWEEFILVDKRDQGIGEEESGQAVERCMKLADYSVKNDGTLDEIKKKVEDLYEEVERRVPRPNWDEYFIGISQAVARRATCNRGRSGCVISRDKQILVTGYVGSPKGLPHCDEVGHQMKTTIHEDGSQTQHCVRTTHAEQNAVCQSAKLGISIDGATLYCKMTPCSVCAKLIINSGIKRVVCEKKYHVGAESEIMFSKAGVKLDILHDEMVQYKNQ